MAAAGKKVVLGVLVLGGLVIAGIAGARTASAAPARREEDTPPPPSDAPPSSGDEVEVDTPDDTGLPNGARVPVEVPDVGPAKPRIPPGLQEAIDSVPGLGEALDAARDAATTAPGEEDAPSPPQLPPAVADAVAQAPESIRDVLREIPGLVDAVPELETPPELPAPTELADAETDPAADPYGTIGLARLMIARESQPGWKDDLREDVAEWQRKVGLTPDGKFGLSSATRMAEEAIPPLVRYWTVGSHWDRWSAIDGPKGYRKAMAAVLARLRTQPEKTALVRALEAAIPREQAQGLAANPPPVPSLEQVARIHERLEAQADEDAAKLIETFS